MPSSSARCAQLPRAADKVPFYAALKKFRDYLNGHVKVFNDSEFIFNDPKYKICCEQETKSSSIVPLLGIDEGSGGSSSRSMLTGMGDDTLLYDDISSGGCSSSKKKRGRPKKVRIGENNMSTEENMDFSRRIMSTPMIINPHDNNDSMKKKRGRPKKIKQLGMLSNTSAFALNNNINNGQESQDPLSYIHQNNNYLSHQQSQHQIPPQQQHLNSNHPHQHPQQHHHNLHSHNQPQQHMLQLSQRNSYDTTASIGESYCGTTPVSHVSTKNPAVYNHNSNSAKIPKISTPTPSTYQQSTQYGHHFVEQTSASGIGIGINGQTISPHPISPHSLSNEYDSNSGIHSHNIQHQSNHHNHQQMQQHHNLHHHHHLQQQQQQQDINETQFSNRQTLTSNNSSPISSSPTPPTPTPTNVTTSSKHNNKDPNETNTQSKSSLNVAASSAYTQQHQIHESPFDSPHHQPQPQPQIHSHIDKLFDSSNTNTQSNTTTDVSTKSLSGLESLVEQIPSINDDSSPCSSTPGSNPTSASSQLVNATPQLSSSLVTNLHGNPNAISNARADDPYNLLGGSNSSTSGTSANCLYTNYSQGLNYPSYHNNLGTSVNSSVSGSSDNRGVATPQSYGSLQSSFSVSSLTANSYNHGSSSSGSNNAAVMEPPHIPVPVTPLYPHPHHPHHHLPHPSHHPHHPFSQYPAYSGYHTSVTPGAGSGLSTMGIDPNISIGNSALNGNMSGVASSPPTHIHMPSPNYPYGYTQANYVQQPSATAAAAYHHHHHHHHMFGSF